MTATATYNWSHSLDDESSDVDYLPPGTVLQAHSNWGPSDLDIRHSFKAHFRGVCLLLREHDQYGPWLAGGAPMGSSRLDQHRLLI